MLGRVLNETVGQVHFAFCFICFNLSYLPMHILGVGFLMPLFFFPAEDGIRDLYVTGVPTCALPICCRCRDSTRRLRKRSSMRAHPVSSKSCGNRSEERRVGKECRSRWSPEH